MTRQLATIQRRRRQVNELRRQICIDQQQTLQEKLNHASLLEEQALQDYQSTLYRNQKNRNLWQLAGQWSSWTDCFQISHRGAFGTINGLRLGAEALALQNPSTPEEEEPTAAATNTATTPSPRLPFSFLLPDNQNNSSLNNNSTSTNGTTPTARPTIKVPWVEINGALGHVALLLVTMQERLQSIDASFCVRHVIKSQGSTSQIGTRRTTGNHSRDTNPVVSNWYPLYSDDNSFPFVLMGKRNFQMALQCLVECVVDAAQAIETYDRTIVLPYPMEQRHHQWTVGGSSIQYHFNSEHPHHHNDAMEWTRAMKYLLINVKQLMTFRAFYLYSDS